MTDIEKKRQQLINSVHGQIPATYLVPDGYAEGDAIYSRQKPQFGEYLPLVATASHTKAEYMAGHETEPVYRWETAPQEQGKGLLIKFD